MISPQPHQTLRIFDANLNRACEGFRVLEDIARLLLDDAAISQRLKTLRHELATTDLAFNTELLGARDAASDIGQATQAPGQEATKDIPSVVVANARRVQESLRTLEEIAKTSTSLQIDATPLMNARFETYTIERELVSRLLRREVAAQVTGLHAIVDAEALDGRDPMAITRELIDGGAQAIQLRDKCNSKSAVLDTACKLRDCCAERGVLFIMNDYADLALASRAHGLHLGQDDLPIASARAMLSIDIIVGISTHSVTQARAAAEAGADYIAAGSVYPTPTKGEAIIIGLDGLRQIREAVTLPLVAIGGITAENAAAVMEAGADSVAVISAVLRAASPKAAAHQITEAIEVSDEPDGC